MLVQTGTLRVGDIVAAGASYGKVRSLLNDLGKPMEAAGPSIAALVVGLNSVPQVRQALWFGSLRFICEPMFCFYACLCRRCWFGCRPRAMKLASKACKWHVWSKADYCLSL